MTFLSNRLKLKERLTYGLASLLVASCLWSSCRKNYVYTPPPPAPIALEDFYKIEGDSLLGDIVVTEGYLRIPAVVWMRGGEYLLGLGTTPSQMSLTNDLEVRIGAGRAPNHINLVFGDDLVSGLEVYCDGGQVLGEGEKVKLTGIFTRERKGSVGWGYPQLKVTKIEPAGR